MSLKFLLFLNFMLINLGLQAQKTVTISGKITEKNTQEVLIGAVVMDTVQRVGVTTNQYGFYTLKLKTGYKVLNISYVGYSSRQISLPISKDTTLNIELEPTTLNEIIIKNDPTMLKNVGFLSLPVVQLKKIPMLMGEPDMMKALAMTPGVMVGQEGSSGMYVRGSSPEQNLILLDEAPVYNTAHAFGFLSVFNPDALKNIDLYKGGFPARYGGRAASVIDITTKDGNKTKHEQELAIGLVNARLLLEGPIKKYKTSYLLTARQMNTFMMLLPQSLTFRSSNRVSNQTNIWLYDINAKIHHQFKDKSQLFLSLYTNYDYWRNAEKFGQKQSINTLNWGNTTATLRYNKMITPKLFAKATALYTHFGHRLHNETMLSSGEEKLENSFNVANTIRDWGLRANIEYSPSNHLMMQIGGERYWHLFRPGQVNVISNNVLTTNQSEDLNTQEQAWYIETEVKPFRFFQLNTGLRYVTYHTTHNTTYRSLEPRIGSTISLSSSLQFKLGATQMRQFVHQLSSNGIGIPNDIWVPATQKVRPILANQIDAGFYWNINKAKGYTLSVEAYQKQLIDLIDYPQGTDIVSDLKRNWQDIIVTNVEGRVKGIELMMRKDVGKLTGWFSYTLSNSQRRSTKINEGEWFQARYDRTHSVALVVNYHFNKKWQLNVNGVYQTGFPVTLPIAAMLGLNSLPTLIYDKRNNNRMPDYHRLDIGANYHQLTKRGRESTWSFGIYNLYNRANPYYLEAVVNTKQVAPSQFVYDGITINQRAILPFLPYFSYQLKLNKP
ncbi:MAG: TonB-dependent receptor [Runella sp.]